MREKKMLCSDCLLFHSDTNYCAHYDDYEHSKDDYSCKYLVTQDDYDFMLKEQYFDLDYFIDNY